MENDQQTLERLKKQLIIQVVFITVFVAVLLSILCFSERDANAAGANAVEQILTRHGIWVVIFGSAIATFEFGIISWLVYWSKRLPPERFPKASYIFAASAAMICAVLGIFHAVNSGLNAFGFGIMCGFAGLMVGGMVGMTFAAPRDAAKGACGGSVLGLLTCALDGWVRLQSGRPLWDREAWEARGVWLPFCALAGAIFAMLILRIKRFKRQLAGERVDRLSR